MRDRQRRTTVRLTSAISQSLLSDGMGERGESPAQ